MTVNLGAGRFRWDVRYVHDATVDSPSVPVYRARGGRVLPYRNRPVRVSTAAVTADATAIRSVIPIVAHAHSTVSRIAAAAVKQAVDACFVVN